MKDWISSVCSRDPSFRNRIRRIEIEKPRAQIKCSHGVPFLVVEITEAHGVKTVKVNCFRCYVQPEKEGLIKATTSSVGVGTSDFVSEDDRAASVLARQVKRRRTVSPVVAAVVAAAAVAQTSALTRTSTCRDSIISFSHEICMNK